MAKSLILIADNEELIRETLGDFLEDRGYGVILAASGAEGLEVLRTKECALAVVDLGLGDMSGENFIREARVLRPAIRFIIYTGDSGYDLKQELEVLGITATSILKKPLRDMEQMVRVIRELQEKS